MGDTAIGNGKVITINKQTICLADEDGVAPTDYADARIYTKAFKQLV